MSGPANPPPNIHPYQIGRLGVGEELYNICWYSLLDAGLGRGKGGGGGWKADTHYQVSGISFMIINLTYLSFHFLFVRVAAVFGAGRPPLFATLEPKLQAEGP